MFRFQPLSIRPGSGIVQFGRPTTTTTTTTATQTSSSSDKYTSSSTSNGRRGKKERLQQSSKPSTMFINNVHDGPIATMATATMAHDTSNNGMSNTEYKTPTDYAKAMLRLGDEDNQEMMEDIKVQYKFVQPTDTQLDSYTIEAVNTVRSNDIDKMRALYEKGQNFNACNRNGETLLHMACRCCTVEIVKFLIDVAKVDVNVIDSVGRNVLHDICWRHRLDVDMMVLFINKINPYMFVLCDNRGHTCFDYCRKEHYEIWITFLKEHASKIVARSKSLSNNGVVPDNCDVSTTTPEQSHAQKVNKDEQVLLGDVITIGGQHFFPLKDNENLRPRVVQQQEQEQQQKSTRTLKRKDSSPLLVSLVPTTGTQHEVIDLTCSRSSSPEPTSSLQGSWYVPVQLDDGCQDSLMNEPLRKKSHSMVNLQELGNEATVGVGVGTATDGDVNSNDPSSFGQFRHSAFYLRRIQSATCPLATLAAVAAAAAALEEVQQQSAAAATSITTSVTKI